MCIARAGTAGTIEPSETTSGSTSVLGRLPCIMSLQTRRRKHVAARVPLSAQLGEGNVMTRNTKRNVVAALTAAAVTMSLSTASCAAGKVVKVGISLAMSGPVAALGDSIWRGVSLYQKLHENSLPNGLKIEVIQRDDAGNSDNIKRIAQELIVRDGVRILGGVALSPQGFALAPLVTRAKIPLVIMNASTASITRESPYIVRTSTTLWQTSFTLGEWAAANGHKKVYTLVADYAAGLDAEAAFNKGFTGKGGQIVGSVRAPVTTTDYLPYTQNIKSSGADTVFMFVNAGRINAATTAFVGAGLKQAGLGLIGPGDVAMDDDIANMGDNVVGLTTAGVYYAKNPVQANQEFLAAWKKEYGANALPNFLSVAGWDGMAAIYDLVRSTGGNFTSDQAMKFLSNWKNPDSPRGPVAIDPQTRDIVQTVYINKVEMVDGKPANVNISKVENVKDPWKRLNPPK
jgi:branched-chain amino acid transport system substrate-binding protein